MVFAFGSYTLLNNCLAQTQAADCRTLTEQVWYDSMPPRNGSSYRVVTVELKKEQSVLVTAAKGGFYGTSDLGRNWTPLKGGKWALELQFPNVIPAPSDPSV